LTSSRFQPAGPFAARPAGPPATLSPFVSSRANALGAAFLRLRRVALEPVSGAAYDATHATFEQKVNPDFRIAASNDRAA